MGYCNYLEQITYLLFLKMADEYSNPPYNRTLGIPAVYKIVIRIYRIIESTGWRKETTVPKKTACLRRGYFNLAFMVLCEEQLSINNLTLGTRF